MKIEGNKWEKSVDYGAGTLSYVHELSDTEIWPPKVYFDGEPLGTKEKPWNVTIEKDGGKVHMHNFKTREEAQRFFNKYKEKVLRDEEAFAKKEAKKIAERIIRNGEYR